MLKEIFKKEVTKQFIRFCLIGLESTVLTYLVFTILLYFLLVNYLISFAIGFITGIFFGFTFNRLWTFESERDYSKEVVPYFLVCLISLGVGILLIRFLVDTFSLNPLLANIPIIGVTTFINFFGTKIIAFKNRKW